MAKTTKLNLVDEKIDEIVKTIAALKTNDSISKNTRGTQLYARSREKRVLHLIRTLLEANPDITLPEDDANTFVLITTLASERVVTKYVFNEGDDLLAVLESYPNLSRKDLEEKLAKRGLKLDLTAKAIVKA